MKQEMRWLDEETVVKRALPLEVFIKSEAFGFTVTPTIGATYGVISGIRVQDVVTGKWYNWDRGVGWSPSTPYCTPGVKSLYIAFWAVNQGVDGNLTLHIEAEGETVIDKTAFCYYNAGVGVEVTIDMPSKNYMIGLAVIP